MTTRDIRLNVLAEVRQYQAEMKKIPGVTEREAARAAVKLEKELTKAQAAAAKEALKAAKQAGGAWSAVGPLIASSLSADAIKGAAVGVYDFVGSVHEARTEVLNLAAATDIGTDTLAGLQLAASRGGVQVDEILGGFEDFGEVLFDFELGGGRAAEALELLNVKATNADGTFRGTDEVLREVIGKMSAMEDGAEKNAVAQQLFGDAGNRLNAILGDSTLEDHIALAERYGIVVDEEAAQATREWNAALADLEGVLAGTVAGLADMVGAGEKIAAFTLGFVYLREVATASLEEVAERVTILGRVSDLVFAGDFRAAAELYASTISSVPDAIEDVAEQARQVAYEHWEATKAMADHTEGAKTHTKALGQLAEVQEREAAAARDRAKEEAKRAKEWTAGLDEIVDAEDELAALQRDMNADTLSDAAKIQRAYEDRIEAIEAIEETLGATAETEAARHDAELERMRAEQEQRIEFAEELRELEQEINDELEAMHERKMQRIEQIAATSVDALGDVMGAIGTLMEVSLEADIARAESARDLGDQQLAQVEELLAAAEEATSEEERIRLEMYANQIEAAAGRNHDIAAAEQAKIEQEFYARQTLEAAAALISGASAAIAALAPPPIGYGPLVGIGMAAAIGITTSAEISKINAQKPPQFDAGYASYTTGPDNYPATLRAGESVLNQTATDNLGGPAAVQAMNQGAATTAGGAGDDMLRDEAMRILGRLMADEIGAGRELGRAVRGAPRVGNRPVYGRR